MYVQGASLKTVAVFLPRLSNSPVTNGEFAMRASVAVVSCIILVGCDFVALGPPPRGGAIITKVADELRRGRPEKARELLRQRSRLEQLPKIELMDPSDPLYCTEEGVETRLDEAAGIIAGQAIDLHNTAPAVRYAVFKKDFEAQMEMQDGIFYRAGYCENSLATLTLAYDRARRPIVDATQIVIAQYRSEAEASVTGDFDAAVDRALNDHEEAQRQARRDDCQAARREEQEIDAGDNSVIAASIRMRVRHCEMIGR